MSDPIEKIVEDALRHAGIAYTDESRNKGRPQKLGDITLDFHLVDADVWIEVKQFHSERTTRQMASAPNVIAVQGRAAADLLANWIRGGR